MITPQHVLLLAWPVLVSVYAATQIKKRCVPAESSRHSRWPKPSVQLHSSVQVERPGNAVCLVIPKGGGLKEEGVADPTSRAHGC